MLSAFSSLSAEFIGIQRTIRSIENLVHVITGLIRLEPEGGLDGDFFPGVEAIVSSMTPAERRKPEIINGSRRRRISRGSGTTPQDINQLLNQFRQTQKMMRQLSRSRNPKNLMSLFR